MLSDETPLFSAVMHGERARAIESHDELAFGRAFEARLGRGAPPRTFFAPGRVNLMGAHLDYNGGPVMPTAIDRGTWIAVRERPDARVALASTHDAAQIETSWAGLPSERAGRWHDYPVGVLREIALHARARGVRLVGVDVLFGGNLPIGAGLSSSASICVGTAFALDRILRLGLEPLERVEAALRAERAFVGVQCGIMDPFAVGFARERSLLWLDCKDRTTEHVPLDLERYSIVLADSLVRRELAQGAFNERVQQCASAFESLHHHQRDAVCLRDVRLETLRAREHELEPAIARRARHVIEEVARTLEAKSALLRGDVRAFGGAMTRAHASLRDHFEVSVPELDQLVESAVATEGVCGARLTGAGFGGCVVVLLEKEAEEPLRERLVREFAARFGREPHVDSFRGDPGPRELAPPGGSR